MHLGVILPNYGKGSSPDRIRRVAEAAEEFGFDSVWARPPSTSSSVPRQSIRTAASTTRSSRSAGSPAGRSGFTTTASRSSVVARHEPRIGISQWPLVSYVDDVTIAMTKAKEAGGDRNVLVHGAGITRLALAAGVLDELELQVVPVLFGQGRRLFEGLSAEQIELRRTRVLEGENGVTHIHCQVQR